MSGTQPGEHTGSAEVGWSGLGVSLPFVLLGRSGVPAFLGLWTFGPYIPLYSLLDTLTVAPEPVPDAVTCLRWECCCAGCGWCPERIVAPVSGVRSAPNRGFGG